MATETTVRCRCGSPIAWFNIPDTNVVQLQCSDPRCHAHAPASREVQRLRERIAAESRKTFDAQVGGRP